MAFCALRPWLKARMPKIPTIAGPLAAGLAAQHGLAAGRQHQNLVAIAQGQIEIMAGHQGNRAGPAGGVTHRVEHVELPVQVQGAGGLIQQHQWRLAYQYLSQPYHLALTTRHFRQSPKRQLPDTQGVENLFDRQLGLFPGPVAASRAAGAEHSFVGHQGNGLGQWLRQVADTTNALVGSNRRQILPGKGHGAGNRQQASNGFQQRGFTHSVRANHGHQ